MNTHHCPGANFDVGVWNIQLRVTTVMNCTCTDIENMRLVQKFSSALLCAVHILAIRAMQSST